MGPSKKVPERVAEMDAERVKRIEATLEFARTGPSVLRRRGSPPAKAWTPPQNIEFSDPDYGDIQVHVATGAVYEKDADEEEKQRIVDAARIKV